MGPDKTGAASGAGPRIASRRLALCLFCLASFVAVVDTTIVSIALPSMRRELGFSGADAQWVLNGYALAFGGLLLVCGRAGDLYGRRLVFLVGLGVFGAASLLGGLAPSPGVLIAARFLQGVGAAAFVPASLSILTTIFAEGGERNRAVGLYGAMAALGFVVGMVGGSNVSLTIAGSGGRREDERGLAACLLNTSIQLGQAWGLGVVATLVAAVAGPGPLVGGLRAGLLACAAFAVVALPIVLLGLPGNGASDEPEARGDVV